MNLDPLRPYADLIRWAMALLIACLLVFGGYRWGEARWHAKYTAEVQAHAEARWAHAAQLQMLDARGVQRGTHAVDEPGGHGAPAAEVHEHPLGPGRRQLLAHLLFSSASEDEMRGGNEFEVFHGSPFCFSTGRHLIAIAAPSPLGAFSNHALCRC